MNVVRVLRQFRPTWRELKHSVGLSLNDDLFPQQPGELRRKLLLVAYWLLQQHDRGEIIQCLDSSCDLLQCSNMLEQPPTQHQLLSLDYSDWDVEVTLLKQAGSILMDKFGLIETHVLCKCCTAVHGQNRFELNLVQACYRAFFRPD